MDELFTEIDPSKVLKTYTKARTEIKPKDESAILPDHTLLEALKREPLTTKNALKFLIEGTLKTKVCRYCLNISSELSELDQILQVAYKETLYKVTIKDMVASFHPFKMADDPNFPDKICEKCIDRTLTSYLFTQQCEQAERALLNCFTDMYEKLNKLDPLEGKKRGRQKLNPNFNTLYAEHEKVMEYADPLIHVINTASEQLTEQSPINELECLKCCELLPNLESLLNHAKIHPKTMWYNCRLCGQSFIKLHHIKKHFRSEHSFSSHKTDTKSPTNNYNCKTCGIVCDSYYKFLQHVEKHKFKMVMEHLIQGKMDNLCAICMDKGDNLVGMDKTICLHGGCPELTGDKPLYKVLASTLPEMNILHNYTGTKICQKCLSHAITSYVFTNHTYFVRNRLNTCVSIMLESLNNVTDLDKNICVEIAECAIMNVEEQFEETRESNNKDESLKVEVLEDEFRIESDEESDTDTETHENKSEVKDVVETYDEPLRSNILLNGFKIENTLPFKKELDPNKSKSACPLCKKHFISYYFLRRHILKHIPKKVACNICKSQFTSNFYMYEHKRMYHILNESVVFSCKICGRFFITEDKLKSHEKRHQNQQCLLCEKTFKCQNRFNDHIKRHMNKLGIVMKKYKQNCSFCEKYCSSDNELSLHVNKAHLQIKPYSCDMCERQFYTDYNLRCHKKLHNRRSKERCEFCNKILHSRKNLVIHIRKHIGDMPFFCQICNSTFYSQCMLGKHMKVYHGGRFCCKFCKTTFENRRELKEHVSKKHSIF